MPARKFMYGSPELWDRVETIVSRPSRQRKPIRRAISLIYMERTEGGCGALFMYPESYASIPPKGDIRGARSDALLLDRLRVAINTGRTTLEEVQGVLSEMYGERARHFWDMDWKRLEVACGDYPLSNVPKAPPTTRNPGDP